ncbi:MAG TPA: hypothetical protein VNJ12_06500 [Candidatus Dormibacteraeota bacterium]|nr:hypothetical protein [Candidatus Dormibacteraeota bacterium]
MLIAGFLALLSIVGLILSFTSGLVASGIDGIFIVLVCLLMLAIFGLTTLSLAAKSGLLPVRRGHK